MLNKTIIALTTATVVASASAAFAYEDPENKIGDRYPFLEQTYQSNAPSRLLRTETSMVGMVKALPCS